MEEKRKPAIDLNVQQLWKVLMADKKRLAIYSLVAGIVGVVIAFSIPKQYEAGVTLAPETSSSNALTSSISSIASMVGMDMAIGGGQDAIYPEIYPDLIQSTDFIVGLFSIRVKSMDGEIDTDFYDYLKTRQKTEWWNYPVNKVKEMLKQFQSAPQLPTSANGEIDPFCLSRDQFEIAKAMRELIDCSVDRKTSVISLSVKAQDPLIAASLCDSIKERLQTYITRYRTNKARHDLAYMEGLCDEARHEYEKAQQAYAAYADAHKNAILTAYVSKQEELENELQLKYSIYQQVSQQLQLAKAKVQERTPAFTVVQSISVPHKHCNKPKVLFLALFMILGFVVRTSMLVWKNRSQVFDIQ